MAMCSGSVDTDISVEESLDVAYARDAAHGGYQFFELCFVAHIDGHFHDAAIVIGGALGFQAADVGVLVGQDARELIEHAGTIVGVDHDAHREGVLGGAGPLHFDFALHVVHQALYVRTHFGVYGHALAAGHVADDGLAANRIAALDAVHHEVVKTAYLDPARAVTPPDARRGK